MTLKIGALCWNQYTDWPALLEAGRRADRLGYDSLWTWDHLYPIVGRLERPDPRGLADARRVGPGDDAHPDRAHGLRQHVPRTRTLTAKMATTLDHIRGGRAILGIGAAWLETEHAAYGLAVRIGGPRATALAGRGAARDPRHAPRRDAVGEPASAITPGRSGTTAALQARSPS